jgi:hypothetical protein
MAVRAETHRAALQPLPERPYVVADKNLRRAGKHCLIWLEATFYSAPASPGAARAAGAELVRASWASA